MTVVWQNEQRLADGPLWKNIDLVSPNWFGRPKERQHLSRRSFHPLLGRAGLRRVRFHDLHHSAATRLLSESVHPLVVSERLGYANVSITPDVYPHPPAVTSEVCDRIDLFISTNPSGVLSILRSKLSIVRSHWIDKPASDGGFFGYSVVPRGRIELPTPRFSVACSTD